MTIFSHFRFTLIAGLAVTALFGGEVFSQPVSRPTAVVDPVSKKNLPNPNPVVIKDWGRLPEGRTWAPTSGVDIGPDGHVWSYDRCGPPDNGCDGSTFAPILKFDRQTGRILKSFGAGLFVSPHGFYVDEVGNIWVADSNGNDAGTKGHQVIKFSPEGKELMRLGKAGVAGDGPDTFNQPCDVITAPNGDIFVADGHAGGYANLPPGATGRIMKFTKDGKFIKEWGKIGGAPGEFRTPHALAFDSQGRLFVADRGNHRIQIFDQEGNFLDAYYQFGRVSGVVIDANDTLYAVESNPANNVGWKAGIRIGSAVEDKVTAFIPGHQIDTEPYSTSGEGVTVDSEGNVYVSESPLTVRVLGGGITKYSKR